MEKHTKKLTILHSNDLHGDFMAEQVDDKLVGGVSMLSGYVSKVRREEENVLYAIAGDMFRGSIIDAEYKGISTIEIMNLLAPDIVTIGNHEVDYGIAHLLFIEKCAKFPIINANLYIKSNGARLFTPYKILKVGGMNILFIGIITEEVLAQARKDNLIGAFIDTKEAAAEVTRICNAYKSVDVDLTVLLTHIGFEDDKKLAAMLPPACGVDLIIGGHSHTLPEQPWVENGIQIVQAGTGTDRIGRFDLVIDTDRNCIDSGTWRTVPITAADCPRDEALEAVLAKYKEATDRKYARIVTRLRAQLTHPQRNTETQLGDLFADILREMLGLDVMLLGSGSIRQKAIGPIVDYGALKEAFPYDDGVYLMKITGAQLRKMMLFMLRDEAFAGDHTEFYQLSDGLQLVYARGEHALKECTFHGEEIADDRVLSVGIQGYHYANLESFLGLSFAEAGAIQTPRVVSTSCLDIIEEYLSTHQLLGAAAGGRLTVV